MTPPGFNVYELPAFLSLHDCKEKATIFLCSLQAPTTFSFPTVQPKQGNQMRTIILNFNLAFTSPLVVLTGCKVSFFFFLICDKFSRTSSTSNHYDYYNHLSNRNLNVSLSVLQLNWCKEVFKNHIHAGHLSWLVRKFKEWMVKILETFRIMVAFPGKLKVFIVFFTVVCLMSTTCCRK